MIDKIPKEYFISMFRTGSSIICDPPVIDTDIDYVILVKDLDVFDNVIKKIGFVSLEEDNYEDNNGKFISYRWAKYNLIVTTDISFYRKFNNATQIAKFLNIQKKEDRVILFKYILYGKLPEICYPL